MRLLNLEGQFLDFPSIWRVFSTFELRAVKIDPKFDNSRQFDEFFSTFEPRGAISRFPFNLAIFFSTFELRAVKIDPKFDNSRQFDEFFGPFRRETASFVILYAYFDIVSQ